ncbi:hypothetical protein PV328_003578 [Microctonus aethiopoides]|uniref:Rrn7/TAF1B C-terminal cyclin domain-containing protein n=1 Tax=Microctonus aethiopoides TaxID=144406 RepID=A0AA39F8Q4_9HYME|nr:hypothetical protein PV328_003578 [Microctonus aethiopoides]
MDACVLCGGLEFYLEAGYYFCTECQTKHEGKREEVADFRIDPTTRLRRTRIRKDKSSSGEEQIVGWTSWEQYNFILIGLANELIELGASMDTKMTLLQLWATYLGKLEVAFTSMNKKIMPRLARRFNKKDAEIIYGRLRQKKKKKRSKSGSSVVSASSMVSSFVSGGSSRAEMGKQKKKLITSEYDKYMQSQNSDTDAHSMTNQSSTSIASSGSDTSIRGGEKIKFNKYARQEAKKVKIMAKSMSKTKRKKFKEKHVTASYSAGPQIITMAKIWGLVYLALRINDDKIHLSDMLRYSREGHISYYRVEHLLPPEVTLNKAEINNLNPVKEISHKGLRRIFAKLANFLRVFQLPHPNLLSLMQRYVTELQLPNGILVYAERMMARSPPNMEFNMKSHLLPNYEGRAMAFIIVAMKILFGLDGITEYEISRVIDKINTVGQERGELESRLFNFCEWQRYIECRRCILVKEHFPTKLRRDPYSSGSSHLYINFIQSIQSKNEGDEPKPTKFKNLISEDLANIMKQSVERLNDNMPLGKNVVVFPPSLTSQHDYLQQLLADPDKDLPSILRQDFSTTKVGYMLKPESLEQLAAQCDIELHVITASAHFMEKIVETFEPPSFTIQRKSNDHNKLTRVITSNLDKIPMTKQSDDPSEYLHRKHPGKIVIDSKKQRLYNKSQNSIKGRENNSTNDFGFDQVHSSGKLKIPNSDDESEDENPQSVKIKEDYKLILSSFERQTMLNSINNPWEKHKKPRYNIRHNGKFIKASEVINNDLVSCKNDDNDTQTQIQKEIMLIDDDVRAEGDVDNDPIIMREILEHEPEIYDSDPDEISILSESIDSRQASSIVKDSTTKKPEILTLFRPYKQFWMFRCVHFSHLAPNHFRLLQRDFPINFRWLLHECAQIVEMNVEELYEEVCLVESYYADVLSTNNDVDMCKKYDTSQYRSESHRKTVKKKWKCSK